MEFVKRGFDLEYHARVNWAKWKADLTRLVEGFHVSWHMAI
jgi:hypothetical protein